MSKVKMPALPVLPYADIINRADIRTRMAEVQLAAAEAMREACIKSVLDVFGFRSYASENGDIYAAQDHALKKAADAIRALEVEQS